MRGRHLTIVPDPTAEAMAVLGSTTIAGLLGTYAHNLAEKERLYLAMEQASSDYADLSAEVDRELFDAWCAVDRRLDLYRRLATEVGR